MYQKIPKTEMTMNIMGSICRKMLFIVMLQLHHCLAKVQLHCVIYIREFSRIQTYSATILSETDVSINQNKKHKDLNIRPAKVG